MGSSSAKLQVQALHKAIQRDDIEAVREALAENPSLVNSWGQDGRAALHVVVCHGALSVLHMILESQLLDVTLTTKSRETPVILSASHSQEEAGLELLTAIPADRLDICAVDSRGWQAVHYAAQQGTVRLLARLLDSGADPEAQDDKLRLTPLMIACQNGQTEVVKQLLDRSVQAGSVDLVQMTPLHHACMASAGGCVEELLTQPGLGLDSQDLNGCTALLYCLKNNNRELEKLLVSRGASLTAALDSGFSDLCYHTIQDSHSS